MSVLYFMYHSPRLSLKVRITKIRNAIDLPTLPTCQAIPVKAKPTNLEIQGINEMIYSEINKLCQENLGVFCSENVFLLVALLLLFFVLSSLDELFLHVYISSFGFITYLKSCGLL